MRKVNFIKTCRKKSNNKKTYRGTRRHSNNKIVKKTKFNFKNKNKSGINIKLRFYRNKDSVFMLFFDSTKYLKKPTFGLISFTNHYKLGFNLIKTKGVNDKQVLSRLLNLLSSQFFFAENMFIHSLFLYRDSNFFSFLQIMVRSFYRSLLLLKLDPYISVNPVIDFIFKNKDFDFINKLSFILKKYKYFGNKQSLKSCLSLLVQEYFVLVYGFIVFLRNLAIQGLDYSLTYLNMVALLKENDLISPNIWNFIVKHAKLHSLSIFLKNFYTILLNFFFFF